MTVSEQRKMVTAALRNPVRVRILEVMNVRDERGQVPELSASGFVDGGMGDDLEAFEKRDRGQRVADISYHLRALLEARAISLTREEKGGKRRGGVEKFYRANAIAYFSDEEWAEMERHEREEISRVVAQGLVVQIEGAMLADTFDSRTDRWLLWDPLKLDEQGWKELGDSTAAFYEQIKEVKADAEARLKSKGEDAVPISTTFAVAVFESPGRWGLPPGDRDG